MADAQTTFENQATVARGRPLRTACAARFRSCNVARHSLLAETGLLPKYTFALLLCTFAVSTFDASHPATTFAASPADGADSQNAIDSANNARPRIRSLLSGLHQTDPAAVLKTEQTLRRLGLTDEQIKFGWLLVHPDPQMRARLPSALLRTNQRTRNNYLLQLTHDADAGVRLAAIRAISPTMIHSELRTRVRQLAMTESDDAVRQRARGLLRHWTAPAVAGPTDSQPIAIPQPSAATIQLTAAQQPLLPPAPALEQIQNPNPTQQASPVRQPKVLNRPIPNPIVTDPLALADQVEPLLQPEIEAPFGFTGPSGIVPTESQQNSHFVPVEDRWRTGFPKWDRYGRGHPRGDDYPGVEGHWWDPYNQNVLKGDYPIIGQHTFLNVTATSQTLTEYRQVPTATSPFESTFNPFQEEFFGNPDQFFATQFYRVRIDLFHGNQAAFKPLDWQVRLTPVFNMNYLDVEELAIVNPNVRAGTTRFRDDFALEEWFIEAKLADLSPDYDFASVRAGSQFFVSDFRGLIFADTNRGVRLFGSQFSNRDQFNLIWLDQAEKGTISGLNTFDDRHQNVVVTNYFRQDFIFPGYTAQASFHYNNDKASFQFDENDFLVRPDPAGIFQEHTVETYYFGLAGDGHIGRINVSNAFYFVTGRDNMNPIGGRELDVNAKLAAIELSYDRDWVRFRSSFFWSSGDDDPNDDKGEGFDSILDNQNFAGGEFSYWNRQAIQLFGVRLVNERSLVPDLRASKLQGQSNFTNPGLFLVNVGMDMDVTPKLKAITNVNYLWFDKTAVLETFTFQDRIDQEIGLDASLGVEYRPFHNDNVIVVAGLSTLVPGDGFKDLYNSFDAKIETLYAGFFEVFLTY